MHEPGQHVHPGTIITFVQEVLSVITQYYRTVGNIWDALYLKHQLRESNLTLDRVYAMLAEFLIELRLHEEQEKITQIVTGSSTSVKHSMYAGTPCMMSTSMPVRERCLPKGKASSEMVKVNSRSGDQHAMIIGSQAVAHKVIIVRSIIQEDSQVDVRYVVLPDMLPHSVLVQSNPRLRMPSGMSLSKRGKNQSGRMINARSRSTRRPRVRKVKGKDPSPKVNQRGRLHRSLLLQGQHSLHRRKMSDPNPNPNPKHVPA